MTIKTKIKTDAIEIEYEGEPRLFKEDLMEVVRSLPTKEGAEPGAVEGSRQATVMTGSSRASKTSAGSGGTTRSIAARLNAKTGPELLLAAAARLHIVEGRDSFRRQDLLEEIKSATGYYTANMAKNLSQNMKTLFKDGNLIELANDVYTLAAESRAELEQRL